MMGNTLDNYAHSNGLKDVNVYFKVLFALLTLIVCLVSTSPIVPLLITFLILFILVFQAKIPFKFYLKFIALPFIFGFLTLVFMALFFGVSEPWFNTGIFNLAVYKDGFNLGFLVFARILGCFSCLGFLALTTPMTELFSILESLKIPKIVIEIAMLMYRFIFVFLGEAENMYHSQKTRMGYHGFKNSFRSLGMLASNLFIRTWIQGEQVYIAMESRGYDGSIKTLKAKEGIRGRNILILVSFESLLLVGVFLTSSFKII
jgi:cobalt/nickel transport system permease protein